MPTSLETIFGPYGRRTRLYFRAAFHGVGAHLFLAILFAGAVFSSEAQDSSLLKSLDDSMTVHAGKDYVTGTFKATHIVNMQTIEAPASGVLNFLIQHRFGQLNSGAYNFFGLDNATLRLGLDYGISDRLSVGVGRSSYLKTFDGSVKYKLLRQTDGNDKMPVSITVFGDLTYYSQRYPDKPWLQGKDRLAYVGQFLIARKINRNLSLELTPSYIHYNLVPTVDDKQDLFALGVGGRMKISRRMSINAEYNYLPRNQVVSTKVYDSFSMGWDIETGGHVFQLVFSNSQSMLESQYLGQTSGSWGKGDIYFGFNLSRTFNLKKHTSLAH